MADIEAKKKRLKELLAEVSQLQTEISGDPSADPDVWQPGETGYYGMYHATSGLLLGIVGAITSLIFNVIGSLAAGLHPLRLIQVYLTFPLGEKALSDEFDTGMMLAVGCCMYIGTGMLLGIPFQMAIAKFIPNAKLATRVAFASVLGLLLWVINFHGILSWLQPMLFGGNWLVDPEILPSWVGVATHLVFAWTMALIFPWGKQEHYQRTTRIISG
ncbi:hypothetical protein ACFL2H_04500 [Planctomycetota bacterium]